MGRAKDSHSLNKLREQLEAILRDKRIPSLVPGEHPAEKTDDSGEGHSRNVYAPGGGGRKKGGKYPGGRQRLGSRVEVSGWRELDSLSCGPEPHVLPIHHTPNEFILSRSCLCGLSFLRYLWMLPKHKYLLSYRYTELVYDGTVVFTAKYFGDFQNRRTREQMDQAARSGKQNVVEGVQDRLTSKKTEMKLLGIARGSMEELISDYEDFLRQRDLKIWPKTDMRVSEFRSLGYRLSDLRNLSDLGEFKEKLNLPNNVEPAANLLLTLCHLTSFLLDRQIKSAEKSFVEIGGFTEELFRKRSDFRKRGN